MNHDQFNSREASELLGITPETLCKWIKTKGIPAEKVNLQWRFERDLLQRWIDKNQYQVPAPISGEPTDTDTLTSAQAAALLGISVSTLNGWAQKGKIQAVKRQRRWHYRRRDVEKLAAAKPSSQASPAAKSRSAGRSRTGAPRPYALGSTTGALLLMPSREAADLYRQEGNWDKAFQRAVDENILSSKSRASAKRQISEIFVRLRALNKRELELILDGDASDRRNILWLAACRRYRFLADFGRDVLAARLNDMKPDLLYVHYDNYLEEKLSEHPEIKVVSKESHKKLRSVLFAMLREAGYLDAQNNIVEADLSFQLVRAISREYRDDLHSIPVNENYLKEMLS